MACEHCTCVLCGQAGADTDFRGARAHWGCATDWEHDRAEAYRCEGELADPRSFDAEAAATAAEMLSYTRETMGGVR